MTDDVGNVTGAISSMLSSDLLGFLFMLLLILRVVIKHLSDRSREDPDDRTERLAARSDRREKRTATFWRGHASIGAWRVRWRKAK